MTDLDLFAVGDNCIDRLTGHAQAVLVGGNAVNVAVQGALAGLRTGYAGAVGPVGEADSQRVRRALTDNGVLVDWLERRDLPTSVTELHVGADGDRRLLREDFGACAGWTPPPATLDALKQARHVHIGWLDDGGATRRFLVGADVAVSQDVSVNATSPQNITVAGLTIAFTSLPEDQEASAQARADALIAAGARAAVVTLGRLGSLAVTHGTTHRAAAEPVKAIDTTGAGDSYIAGFLAARLAGASLPACMDAGHARAAITCTHPGGFPQA